MKVWSNHWCDILLWSHGVYVRCEPILCVPLARLWLLVMYRHMATICLNLAMLNMGLWATLTLQSLHLTRLDKYCFIFKHETRHSSSHLTRSSTESQRFLHIGNEFCHRGAGGERWWVLTNWNVATEKSGLLINATYCTTLNSICIHLAISIFLIINTGSFCCVFIPL